MGARSLVNFYQTLISIARLQLKQCRSPQDERVVRLEMERFERQLARMNKSGREASKGNKGKG